MPNLLRMGPGMRKPPAKPRAPVHIAAQRRPTFTDGSCPVCDRRESVTRTLPDTQRQVLNLVCPSGAVRGSCSRASLVALRPSACGQVAVAVRLIGPASQPAGGAHIRDGACALGPCPWEVPMQSPKPKAARRFPVPYGFRQYHYNTFKWGFPGSKSWIRPCGGAGGSPTCIPDASPQRSVPTFGPAGIYVAESRGRGRW